jgi:hypothetical protein
MAEREAAQGTEGEAPERKRRTTMEFPAEFLQALHRRIEEDPSPLSFGSPREYLFALVRQDWRQVGFDPEKGFVLPRRVEKALPPLRRSARGDKDLEAWRDPTKPKR